MDSASDLSAILCVKKIKKKKYFVNKLILK